MRNYLKNKLNKKNPINNVQEEYLNESYAQHGEDNILFGLLNYKTSGFFVDVGAFHPTRFSNTYKFYKMGWKGINIDPAPNTKKLFDEIRPNDINIELGISDKESELEYYMFEEPALNTFVKSTVENYKKIYPNCKIVGTKKIKVTTLKECLDKNLPANAEIDFMTIDCEGMDYEAIISNDWQKYKPKIVICEIQDCNIRQILDSK